ncbi:hypothetical protein L218DRAFT_240390 [Marasmius fiardii PR-910]|nr:hypothetical protein L218DRAFT_240390 [Marasmius fiardii PR-910]
MGFPQQGHGWLGPRRKKFPNMKTKKRATIDRKKAKTTKRKKDRRERKLNRNTCTANKQKKMQIIDTHKRRQRETEKQELKAPF